MVTPDLKGTVHAGHLVREVARLTGGDGGGRPDLAEAGGEDPGEIENALRAGGGERPRADRDRVAGRGGDRPPDASERQFPLISERMGGIAVRVPPLPVAPPRGGGGGGSRGGGGGSCFFFPP